MIKSKYIYDILDLMLDGDEEGFAARRQLPYLTEDEFEYTDSGVFIWFSHGQGIETFRIQPEDLVLDGVFIEGPNHIQADAILFFADGKIDYLEIFCHQGDYPASDLKRYTLTQIWEDSYGRTIKSD